MNNELQEALTVFLTKSLDFVEKGVNMAGEQIPLVLQEIIQWRVCWSIVGVIGLLLLIAVMLYFCRFFYVKNETETHYSEAGVISFFLGVGALACVVPLGFVLFDLTKALVAPRLVIIDFLKGML